MMLLLYDVGYVDEHVIGIYCCVWLWLPMIYVVWSKALLMISYLVNLIMWGFMGLHMIILLVGLGWDHCYVSCMLCYMVKLTWNVDMTFWWCLLLLSCFMLLWSSSCIYSLVCALKAFKWLSMISKEMAILMHFVTCLCTYTHTYYMLCTNRFLFINTNVGSEHWRLRWSIEEAWNSFSKYL